MSDLIHVADCIPDLQRIYTKGLDKGDAPGWEPFDLHYRVIRGMMTVVTGIPASGKSEFVDAMLVNLAANHGWKVAYFSPENYPTALHIIKLAEKYIGKQYKGMYESLNMTYADLQDAIQFIASKFTWIYPKEDVTLDRILSNAKSLKETTGLDGLVIDPWNEIENNRGGKSETDYISECLTKIRRFSRENEIHTWIVAHPMKMTKNKSGTYDVPTPYDISGSAHWRNKADFCLCVHREDLRKTEATVYVQKVKFKHMGKVGAVSFEYNWMNGRYTANESS